MSKYPITDQEIMATPDPKGVKQYLEEVSEKEMAINIAMAELCGISLTKQISEIINLPF